MVRFKPQQGGTWSGSNPNREGRGQVQTLVRFKPQQGGTRSGSNPNRDGHRQVQTLVRLQTPTGRDTVRFKPQKGGTRSGLNPNKEGHRQVQTPSTALITTSLLLRKMPKTEARSVGRFKRLGYLGRLSP